MMGHCLTITTPLAYLDVSGVLRSGFEQLCLAGGMLADSLLLLTVHPPGPQLVIPGPVSLFILEQASSLGRIMLAIL